MTTDSFTVALREHLKTHGEMKGFFGGESLHWHRQAKPECGGWAIPEGAKAAQDTAYQFDGTDCDSRAVRVIRLATPVSCECGEYRDKTVQIEGTFSELLTRLLQVEVPREVTF